MFDTVHAMAYMASVGFKFFSFGSQSFIQLLISLCLEYFPFSFIFPCKWFVCVTIDVWFVGMLVVRSIGLNAKMAVRVAFAMLPLLCVN